MSPERGSVSSSEKEPRYYGVQKFGLTTAGWLFRPEECLEIASQINELREKENKNPMVAELYATHLPTELLPKSVIQALEKHFPPDLTPDKALALLKKFPNVPIEVVHLPFNFSLWEAVYRATIGEEFFPEVPNGEVAERLKLAFKNRLYQVAWIFFFGQAANGKAIEVASYLHQESQEKHPNSSGTGLNCHPNIIEGFAQAGRLDDIKTQVAQVLAEPERPYYSPIMRELSHKTNVPVESLISDPAPIREHIVLRYELDGMTLGVDHQLAQGTDPTPSFRQVLDVVRNIHIAGGRGSHPHTITDLNNPNTRNFLHTLFTSRHQQPFGLFLDLNPLDMNKLNPEEQLRLIKDTISQLEDYQKESLDRL